MKIGDRVRLNDSLSTFYACEGIIIARSPYNENSWCVRFINYELWCASYFLQVLSLSPEEQELQRRQEHAMKYL